MGNRKLETYGFGRELIFTEICGTGYVLYEDRRSEQKTHTAKETHAGRTPSGSRCSLIPQMVPCTAAILP